jgi:hypothetical protein
MAIFYFAGGAAAALILVLILLTAVYLYLKKKRNKHKAVKGYLDLIPDLTESQRLQVQEIRRTFLPKVEGIRKNLYAARSELAERLFDEPADLSKIRAVAGGILQYQSELEHEVIEHILEEKELLSPAQKRKFYEIIIKEFSSGGLGVHDVRGK